MCRYLATHTETSVVIQRYVQNKAWRRALCFRLRNPSSWLITEAEAVNKPLKARPHGLRRLKSSLQSLYTAGRKHFARKGGFCCPNRRDVRTLFRQNDHKSTAAEESVYLLLFTYHLQFSHLANAAVRSHLQWGFFFQKHVTNAAFIWIQTDGRRQTDNTVWTARETQTNSPSEWRDGTYTRRHVAMAMSHYILVMRVAIKCSFLLTFPSAVLAISR